ncbi:ClbS/DfsB family four-helix bundle protein [Candidatus Saccharibacteria bacterium]|nr:ClbS/DfsB family four-helix bundle protein [Candidatus Saccharibacteria bacterium]
MPRPTTKEDLEKQAEENYDKLMELVEKKKVK